MTRDEIISMARAAGIQVSPNNSFADDMYISVLYRFATIVAATERETCAQLVEKNADVCSTNTMLCDVLRGSVAAIRARGDASEKLRKEIVCQDK